MVGNRNVEELLPEAAQEMFLQATAGVWEQDDLYIINITSALDRGGRVPLPIEGRKEGYEQLLGGSWADPPCGVLFGGVTSSGCPPGRVYVKVGSRGAFSPCLVSATSPESRFRCSLGQQPLASCYDTFAPHFTIRWCNLTLVRPTCVSPTPLKHQPPHGGQPPPHCSCSSSPAPRRQGRRGVPGCWKTTAISSPPLRCPPLTCFLGSW